MGLYSYETRSELLYAVTSRIGWLLGVGRRLLGAGIILFLDLGAGCISGFSLLKIHQAVHLSVL